AGSPPRGRGPASPAPRRPGAAGSPPTRSWSGMSAGTARPEPARRGVSTSPGRPCSFLARDLDGPARAGGGVFVGRGAAVSSAFAARGPIGAAALFTTRARGGRRVHDGAKRPPPRTGRRIVQQARPLGEQLARLGVQAHRR